ncbi:MAG TPA: DUF4179 domain-containing protein [Candidatus Oscillibacter excrementigallinarum]|uniref:DUF4179 domain-containing protein n=1 Tax=Candidatus Oscillibacter excrementigallinarum TaxID=2838716 RepID=A0A9D2LH71_9FIRM|nr:DUF4179 domain-containing protein [Candidatus Oscillibacter excrementigallinarum]
MNRYRDAMEHCAPPPELESRLREAVLSAEPTPQARPAVFRPKGFVRKAALAAVLIVLLTVSAGAVVVANWDAILASRFGAWAASTPMGQAAFQEVHVTSVCDDVTLTVRQALVSEKSLYLILDYHLPDTVDRAAVQQADSSPSSDHMIVPVPVDYYLTGDFSWEDLKAADQDKWADIDWADFLSYCHYTGITGNALAEDCISHYTSGSSGEVASQGYAPESHTLTYLCSITAKDGDLDFTAQPLTLLVLPPVLRVNGVDTAVTDHPAILTFQPEAISQTLTGSWQEDGRAIQVSVSPFSLSVEASGGTPYRKIGELRADTALVFRDGTVQPVSAPTSGLTGGGSRGGEGGTYTSASFTSQFQDLLDVGQVAAVRVGDVEIPLE